mmetsp:Transcript_13586/g.31130  ORF Transcript_13586/g.31130 Transcript_13586/m.31130 type:complete len:226 (+) Transcript_13586:37-714(+)
MRDLRRKFISACGCVRKSFWEFERRVVSQHRKRHVVARRQKQASLPSQAYQLIFCYVRLSTLLSQTSSAMNHQKQGDACTTSRRRVQKLCAALRRSGHECRAAPRECFCGCETVVFGSKTIAALTVRVEEQLEEVVENGHVALLRGCVCLHQHPLARHVLGILTCHALSRSIEIGAQSREPFGEEGGPLFLSLVTQWRVARSGDQARVRRSRSHAIARCRRCNAS